MNTSTETRAKRAVPFTSAYRRFSVLVTEMVPSFYTQELAQQANAAVTASGIR